MMLSPVFLFLDIGGGELMLILGAALLLFGGDKLPELAKGLGKGIRDFKDASEGVKREINSQIDNFEVKKKEEERAKKVDEQPAIENDTNRFIDEKSADNGYLANSVPVSQDYVTSNDQVEFEDHTSHNNTPYKQEDNVQPEEQKPAQPAADKTIF